LTLLEVALEVELKGEMVAFELTGLLVGRTGTNEELELAVALVPLVPLVEFMADEGRVWTDSSDFVRGLRRRTVYGVLPRTQA